MSSTFHFEPPDDREWESVADDAQAVITRSVELFAIEAWGNLRQESPVNHGRLAGSFDLEQVGDREWRVTSGVNYAMAVWQGTDPYIIEPVTASVLRFEVGGQVVFARWVEHPGIPGDDYPERAVDAARDRSDEFIQIAIDEIVRQ